MDSATETKRTKTAFGTCLIGEASSLCKDFAALQTELRELNGRAHFAEGVAGVYFAEAKQKNAEMTRLLAKVKNMETLAEQLQESHSNLEHQNKLMGRQLAAAIGRHQAIEERLRSAELCLESASSLKGTISSLVRHLDAVTGEQCAVAKRKQIFSAVLEGIAPKGASPLQKKHRSEFVDVVAGSSAPGDEASMKRFFRRLHTTSFESIAQSFREIVPSVALGRGGRFVEAGGRLLPFDFGAHNNALVETDAGKEVNDLLLAMIETPSRRQMTAKLKPCSQKGKEYFPKGRGGQRAPWSAERVEEELKMREQRQQV